MCLGNTSIYFSLGKHLMHTNSHSRLHGGDSAEASKLQSYPIPGKHTPANLATNWRWCIQGVSMGFKKNVICKSLRAACWNEWHSRRNKRSINSGLFGAAAGPLLELMSKASDRQPLISLKVLEQLDTCLKPQIATVVETVCFLLLVGLLLAMSSTSTKILWWGENANNRNLMANFAFCIVGISHPEMSSF